MQEFKKIFLYIVFAVLASWQLPQKATTPHKLVNSSLLHLSNFFLLLHLSEGEPVTQRASALGRLQEKEMPTQNLWMILKISYSTWTNTEA